MRAVITGATSGIGLEIAKVLHKKGYDLTLVARRKEKLFELKQQFGEKTQILAADLSNESEIYRIFEEINIKETDILVNNAGFGLCGEFTETSLERETEMIATNVTAVHILTKLFLKEFVKAERGYILNVASIAAFLPGPLLAAYYSTKAYVLTLTESLYGELRAKGSDVYIGALCPGPVKTNFDNVANVKFSLKGADPRYIAEYAVKKMFKRKPVILPTLSVKAAAFFSRFAPVKILPLITYRMQRKKIENQ